MFYILYDKIRRLFIQLKLMLTRNGWKKAEWLKKHKVFHHIGEHCYYHPNIYQLNHFLYVCTIML